jgi:hypothetical protein
MEEKVIAKEEDGSVVEKKVYTPPTLIIYGRLTELTMTGTGISSETKTVGQPKQQRN